MSQSNKKISYLDVINKGKQFNSPAERYAEGVQIICDRCQNAPIMEGYGYETLDICLLCANIITEINYDNDDNLTFMCQEQFTDTSTNTKKYAATASASASANSDTHVNYSVTLMCQKQFKTWGNQTRNDGLVYNQKILHDNYCKNYTQNEQIDKDSFLKPVNARSDNTNLLQNLDDLLKERSILFGDLPNNNRDNTSTNGNGNGNGEPPKFTNFKSSTNPNDMHFNNIGIHAFVSGPIYTNLDEQFGGLLTNTPGTYVPVEKPIPPTNNNTTTNSTATSNNNNTTSNNFKANKFPPGGMSLTRMGMNMFRTDKKK